MSPLAVAALALTLVAAGLLFLVFRFQQQLQSYRVRYSGLINADAELSAVRNRTQEAKEEQARFTAESDEQRQKLSREYEEALSKYKGLQHDISVLEENLEDISFGLYKPHFTFDSPEQYKAKLTETREKERLLIRDNRAVFCPLNWTVGDSKREGQRMVRLNSKLFLRAFNGECDAAIANVSWNNAGKMEERIRKSFEAVNKLGDVLKVSITNAYLDLKLAELRLTHEYEEKKYQERETQRRAREEQREEEKAQQEIEKARQSAEEEETRYQKLLAKAREEAAIATGTQLQKLTEQVSNFEAKLDEARKKKERAIARAQLTKSGFVYVISNIGSFGERVYKIGMTRRMEPMDRIVELGGASVPFPFDLHAMLYSDNAPELESALHRLFEERRLNLVNPRREFYRDVELHEVERFVKDRGLSAQFIETPEAREYRETVAKREQILAATRKPPAKFSDALFQTASAAN
jgi:Domain of unknown function (DUF4041)/Meiotically up-regulated gene 113